MNIPLSDWVELESHIQDAVTAIGQAQSLASSRALQCRWENKRRECEIWRAIECRLQDAIHAMSPSLFRISMEWVGGSTSDPKNFTLREPDIVLVPRTFPAEEVEVYRDEAGEIRLPHRQGAK